ncbi:MAG TPA: glycosyltransferase [Candidatus Nanoarchaeia archaeon]|nr:glycosyltransferase [Candidatus Nanoarchaeia archaeon]
METIIPTRNDYKQLPKILAVLDTTVQITRVYVIDNGSASRISKRIRHICGSSEKARYLVCRIKGKGIAIKKALSVVTEDVLFLDADIENLTKATIQKLIDGLNQGSDLVKADISRKNGQSNSSFILERMRELFPKLTINRPTCGIYCIRHDLLKRIKLPLSWSVDLSVLIQSHLLGARISEVNIGEIIDKPRSQTSLMHSRICLERELEVLQHVTG